MCTVASIVSEIGSLILIFLPQSSHVPTHHDTRFSSTP